MSLGGATRFRVHFQKARRAIKKLKEPRALFVLEACKLAVLQYVGASNLLPRADFFLFTIL